MKLSDYIKKEHIIVNLKGSSKVQVIEELLDRLTDDDNLTDRDLVLQDVLAREGYLSTGLENGIAIPHAKSDGVKSLLISFGIKKDGVDFESLDGKPGQFVFLVVSPRDTSGPHIQALAAISRNLKDADKREALLNAQTAEEVEQIINNFSS
jgi:fructose-specific phosphotransferase system IIA component